MYVHGQQDAVGHILGQVIEDVGEVIGVQVPGYPCQAAGRHLLQQAGTDGFVGVGQDLALDIGIDEAPDLLARLARLAFQQVGDLRGVQFA